LVFSAVYLFTSASIPIYDRLLSPLLPGIYLVLLGAAGIVDQRILHLKFSIPVTGLFITLFFVVFNFSPLQTYLLHSSSPEGYTSPLWKGQPIFDRIAKIPDSTPILSNAPDIILFYTNKDGYFLTPRPKSASSFISVNDLSKIQDIIDTQCGIIALFDPINADSIENKHEFLDAQQVASLKARYVPIYSGKDGELLTAKRCIKE
jgi:hypothetical protein